MTIPTRVRRSIRSTYLICLLAIMATLSACSSTPSAMDYAEEGTTIVYKYDGSTQCNNTGKNEYDMARELEQAGVGVICAAKAADGKVRTVQCGAPSGMMNVYKISSGFEKKAKRKGFRPISELRDYNGSACLY